MAAAAAEAMVAVGAVKVKGTRASRRVCASLSDLETDRKGAQSWHSWFLDDVQNLDIHAVRAKIFMSFFCTNM